MERSRVLIAGAGPTGLVLAIWLAKNNVSFRIVDRNAGPGEASRAMAVQARTLEFYRQLGFGDDVVERGIVMKAAHLWESRRETGAFSLGASGASISRYAFALSFPQDDHERLLVEELKSLGVQVEWGTELVGFSEVVDGVEAALRAGTSEEVCRVDYLCGCDGARSVVRQGLKLEFPGGTYDQVFFVADVSASGNAVNGDLNICFAPTGFCGVFPIRSTGMIRLIGVVPEQQLDGREPSFDDVKEFVEGIVALDIDRVNWFSTYRVHHRVAPHFRVGRAFIAGDAGHIHSPAGGQGMNTGIGDAVNLGWKLAAVLQNRIDPCVLDTYEDERIAFARTLVASTDRAFSMVVAKSVAATLIRKLLPLLGPRLMRFPGVRTRFFLLLSQTRIKYRDSPLSSGVAGAVHGGDRLPWVQYKGIDNHEPLKSLDWQVHVYGAASHDLHVRADALGIELHVFEWTRMARKAGFHRDATYLVRPDGYIAFIAKSPSAQPLEAYLTRWKILPRRAIANPGA